jgi:regulator of protease activity HflC (stomatin/prohibitin superfamily)
LVFSLAAILNGQRIKGVDQNGNPLADENGEQQVAKADKEGSDIWKQMRDDWGVEAESVALSDIALPEDIAQYRASVLEASKKAEAAIQEAKAKLLWQRATSRPWL